MKKPTRITDGKPLFSTAHPTTPLDTQVGGSHYKDMAIQPVTYIHANKLGFLEGNVVKYISRHAEKGGRQDIEKVIHYCQLLLQLEYGVPNGKDTLVGGGRMSDGMTPITGVFGLAQPKQEGALVPYDHTELSKWKLAKPLNKRSIAAKKRWAKVKAKKAAFKRLASKVLSHGDKPKAKTKAKRK